METIEDCISFLCSKAAQTVSRLARARLDELGVTPVQFALLQAAWQRPGQTASELGAYLVMDSATVTGVIERLNRMLVLERRPDPGDRRVTRIFLTPSGNTLTVDLQARMDAMNAEVAQAFGADAEPLWRLLGQLARFEISREKSADV